jgi:hypothetical protein
VDEPRDHDVERDYLRRYDDLAVWAGFSGLLARDLRSLELPA